MAEVVLTGSRISQIATNTPLSGGAAYTSDWVDVSNMESVVFACLADVAGTLYAQFSYTGAEAAGGSPPSTLTYPVLANANAVHRLLRTRQYFRLRFVNGAGAQSSFDLSAFMGSSGFLTSAVNSSVSQDADSLLTRSVPPGIEVSAGLFTGYSALSKFGKNSDIDTTSTPEDLWESGSIYTGQPVGAAETVEVFSGDAADTAAGTGARTMRIDGLDANGDEQTEDLTLNGTTEVASAVTWNRVFRGYVLTGGSGGSNAGIITCRHTSTTANVFFGIPIGANQTQVAAYTVPTGKTLYITAISIQMARTSGAAGSAQVYVAVRPTGGVYRHVRIAQISNSLGYNASSIYGAITVDAGGDIKIGVSGVSDNNTSVVGEFIGVLVDV